MNPNSSRSFRARINALERQMLWIKIQAISLWLESKVIFAIARSACAVRWEGLAFSALDQADFIDDDVERLRRQGLRIRAESKALIEEAQG